MEKSIVKNEFECQEKCIEKESRCKSCNVYLEAGEQCYLWAKQQNSTDESRWF